MAKSRTQSSRAWLDEHFNDPYVKQAQKEGWRSRAAYKLLEIQEKDHLIRPGMNVIDLGAAPGSWSQVVSRLLKGQGRLIALDRLPMDVFEEMVFIEGDFSDEAIYQRLMETLGESYVDVILSDMAPNMSGNKHVDQPKLMRLLELALDFAKLTLKPKGALLVKAFHGEGFEGYLKALRAEFRKVVIRKPNASRARSSEIYLLATGFMGQSTGTARSTNPPTLES